jgi:hypothetical protein
MDEIDKNIKAFEKVQNELEKDSLGKWVLFHNLKLIDTFNTFEEAAEEATIKFGAGPYLIRQVGVSSIALPVSVMSK